MGLIEQNEDRAFWMTAKRDGACWECFVPIDTGDRIVWDANEQHAYCTDCGQDVAGYPDPQA